jgi:hypothetical protein
LKFESNRPLAFFIDGGIPMRPLARLVPAAFVIAFIFTVASVAHASAPAVSFNKRFGNTSIDRGRAIAIDASGNVYVAGSFQTSIDFGGGTLTSAGGDEAFLAKFDSNGNHLWSKSFGQVGAEASTDVAVDASGNVYLTGYFNSTVNFGGSALFAVGGFDMFLAKFNSLGVHQWSKNFGSGSDDFAYALTLDPSSNVIITGTYRGTTPITWGGANFGGFGLNDTFLAKFNSAGTHIASVVFGGTGNEFGGDVGTDAAGNVYLTGYFENTVNFGGGALVSAGSQDIILAKYDANLVHVWSKRLGSTGSDIAYSLSVNPTGEVQVTGAFNNTVDFGGGGRVSGGGSDVFLARYSSAGTHLWSHSYPGASNATGYSLSVDGTGRIFMAGTFAGAMDLGGGTLTSAGLDDIFVGQFTSGGAHIWSARFGNTGQEDAPGCTGDALGRLALTGGFSNTINFGAGTLSSTGLDDILVVKFTDRDPYPLITSIIDIGNDQGRKVKVRFNGTGYDYSYTNTVTSYELYRKDGPAPVMTSVSTRNPAGLSPRELRVDGWTLAASTPAHGDATYGVDAPTIGDSTLALGQYNSVFFVRAATGATTTYYDSPPDSGYSIDNLAPAVPSNFVFTAGNLAWNQSTAEDFDYFTVYGSNINSFGAATLVNYTITTGMNVNASPYTYYFVTATDFSGNEGRPAIVNSLSGVGDTPRSYVLSVSNYPNPFNPRTTVKYTVPSRGVVDINVYDASGAHVATLFHGERSPGAYAVEWDGRADSGVSAASGIYFARISENDATRTRKMILLK